MDNKFLNTVRILFIGIFLAPLMFLGVILFTQSGQEKPLTVANDPFFFIVVIMSVGAIIASTMLYKKRLPAIQEMTDTAAKLNAWKSLLIIKLAIIEGVTLFAVVVLQIQLANIYLFIALALSAYQLTNIPTEEKIKTDCNLQ